VSASSEPSPVASRGPLPSGTVTFAFTDIEGSTQRWERDREAMRDAVRRHDVLVRAAIEAHDGHVFKTIGDAFCAAFSRPEDAVAAIVAAQRALVAEDFSAVEGLRVRAAIHTGTSDERGGDYYGPAVNRVARLLAIGHGGQTLVSGVTTDLVQGLMPRGATLHDLGQHRLKDLAYPEQVYQLLAPELEREFPPLRSLDVLANNLPRQVTPLIGREREVAEICALLETAPLVTLVGSGGVGKTRVSLQVAANLVDGSGDGVWFVELAPIVDVTLVPLTIASAVGLTLSERQPPMRGLVEQLAPRRMLIVLDNCEHVVDDVATVSNDILRHCPGVKLLASSREGLGIDGEIVYRMASLDVPPEDARVASVIQAYGAVELFVTRAKAASRTFSITDANASAIGQIVRRLDGIPLAIELAAARLNVLAPEQLLDRLDDRLRILTGGDRTRLPRQQTLRALIDWSYDLLSEQERAIFRALGTFVGGWTLETATALMADDFDDWEVLDVLGSLVAKSLVVADIEEGASPRYRLLESTRQYSLDRQNQAGETTKLARKHCEVFRQTVIALDERLLRADGRMAATALVPELDNLRAAVSFGFGNDGDIDVASDIVSAGYHVWIQSTSRMEFAVLAVAALARISLDSNAARRVVRAKLELAIAYIFDLLRRDREALEYAERARAVFLEFGDRPRVCIANECLSYTYATTGRFEEGNALLSEAVDIARDAGMPFYLARGLRYQGNLAFDRGEFDKARVAFDEVRRLLPKVDVENTSLDLAYAELEFATGNVEAAIETAEKVVALYRSKAPQNLLGGLLNLTAYRLCAGDRGAAGASATEAFAILGPDASAFVHLILIEHVAVLAALDGALEEAAVLLGFSSAALSVLGGQRERTERIGFERLSGLLEALDPELRASLFERGAALDEKAAVDRAKAVVAGTST
jgi:predicted ATPase/class 3 adenylate cyclase